MAHAAPVRTKIPTKNPQPARAGAARPARQGRLVRSGLPRPATRGDGNPVIELECGITVYPARKGQDRWRAVWYENGQRRQCEAVSGERLAARLETVAERLAADAPNMERTGADLIAHYLDPDRLPADRRWLASRACAHPAQAVRAVRRPGDRRRGLPGHYDLAHAASRQRRAYRQGGCAGARDDLGPGRCGRRCGYLANPRLAKVHWQAGDRPLPPPRVSVAGESGLWVDPAEIPSADDVERLGKALAAGRHGERDQLMPTPRLSIGSNPTPATTCENGPLSAETRPGGTFFRLPRLGRLSPHSRSYAPSLAGKSLAGLWAAGLALQRFL